VGEIGGGVCEINQNSRNPAKEIPDKEFLYIDITSVESGTGEIKEIKKILGKNAPSRARRVIHQDDVIMSTVRPYLKAFAVIPPEYDNQICSTGFAVLSCNSGILPKFLLYALFSEVVIEQCNKMMIGAHYPALNNEQVSEIKIPLPPLPEQKRIVARIEALFSKIDEIKRLRKEANDLAKTLLPSALHEVFSKADEKGWRWVRLGEVCKVFSGSSAPQDDRYFEAGKYPFVRVQDLGKFGRTDNLVEIKDWVNDLAVNKFRLVKASKGTIVFPKSGAAILTNTRAILGVDAFIVSHLAAVQPLNNFVLSKFVYYWLYQVNMANYIENPAYPSLKLSTIKNLQIPLPPLEEQKRIVAYLDNIQQKAQALQRLQEEIEMEIERLRESILHKAFRGEL